MASVSLTADRAARSGPVTLTDLALAPAPVSSPVHRLRQPASSCTLAAASVPAPIPMPMPVPMQGPRPEFLRASVPCAGVQAPRPLRLALVQPHLHTPVSCVVRSANSSLAKPGGLVITGRLEDVCAELDRLVALEELH